MAVIFALLHPRYYFMSTYYIRLLCFLCSVTVWSAFLALYSQDSLIQDQGIRSLRKMLTYLYAALSSTSIPVYLSVCLSLSLKYHIILILLHFFISTGLAQGLPLGISLSQSLHFLLCCRLERLHHGQAIYKMAFLCLSTLGNLTQDQWPECVKSSICLLLSPAGLFLQGTKLIYLCTFSSEELGGWNQKKN